MYLGENKTKMFYLYGKYASKFWMHMLMVKMFVYLNVYGLFAGHESLFYEYDFRHVSDN